MAGRSESGRQWRYDPKGIEMAPSAAYVPALKRREAQKGGKQERVQLVLPISEITGW